MTKQTSQTQRQRKFEAEGCLNLLLSRISAPISAVRTKLSAPFTKLASRLPAVNIKKTRHRLFLISVAGIVLTAPIVWAFIAHPWSTEAAWWDDHWLYRQKIAIPYTGSTELTDFQIELAAVDTTGLNSAGKLESNCDDLRFTDNHGDLLPYWINDESDSNDTLDCSANNYDIWVKIPSIPQSGTDIYMYYGNPNAESVISGNETFDYFDDFTLGTIDDSKWITNGSPATGSANISLLDFDALVSKSSFCNSSPGDNDSCAVGMRAKQSSTGLNAGRIGFTSLEGFDSIEWWNTNFSRRKQITVSATDAVDTGYTVSYSALGSDAADIYNDCLSSGDDFRIVYWDSDSWLELDRKLVTFTSSAIEVWFALQKDIGASSSDNNYFIYYDYGASGSPPADLDNIYLFQDDAESGNVTDKWTDNGGTISSVSYSSTYAHGGSYSVRCYKFVSGTTANCVSNVLTGFPTISSDYLFDLWVYFPDTNPRRNLFVSSGGNQPFNTSYESNADICWIDNLTWMDSGTNYGTGAWEHYEFYVWNSTDIVNFYRNGTQVATDITRYSTVDNTEGVAFAIFKNFTGNFYIDDVSFRMYTNNEPTTSVGPEIGPIVEFNSDDSSAFLFDSTTGGNHETENAESGDVETGTVSVTENTSFHDFEITLRTTGSTFDVDGTTGTLTTEIVNSTQYVRLQTTDPSNTLTIDHVYVRKLATTAPGSANFSSEELSPGPTAYWALNEGQGTTAYDHIGNSDGTITGATWQSEDMCISGKCLKFDDTTDQYVDMGKDISIRPTDGLTISLWIKPNDIDNFQHFLDFVEAPSGNYNGYWLYVYTDHRVRFLIGDGDASYNQFVSTTTINENEWIHIEATWDGTTMKLYFNGVQDVTTLGFGGSIAYAGGTDLFLGSSSATGTTNVFDGFMDEVKIYPYARTAAEVKTDFLRGASSHGSQAVIGASNTSYLNEGLVGYWKVDESASPAADSSGNNGSGTWGGNATSSAGKYGDAISLDGTDDFIQVDDSGTSPLDVNTTFSFAAWVYRTVVGGQIFNKENSYEWKTDGSGNINWAIQTNGSWEWHDTNVNVAASTWTHIVLTYDGTSVRIYKNGTLANTTADPDGGGITQNDSNLCIGTRGGDGCVGGEDYTGRLDEVRIYNRALSNAEIFSLYSWAPGPVAYYNFDEGEGTALYDQSGHANDSTQWNGSPTWQNGKYGGALYFDGSGTSGVEVNSPHDFTSSTFTAEVWVDGTSQPAATRIINYGTNGSNYGGFIIGQNTNGTLRTYIDTTGSGGWDGLYSTGTVNDGNWHHLVLLYDGTNRFIYIDGVKDASTDIPSAYYPSPSSPIFTIGQSSLDNEEHNGKIDEIRIYNYARTPQQIIQDMNAGHPAPGSPVGSSLLQLHLDEDYGTVTYDSGTNGDDGDLLDGASWTTAGKKGRTIELDGTNDRIQGFTSDPFEYRGDDLTLSVWLNRDTGDSDPSRVISKPWNGGGQYNYTLDVNANDTVTFSLLGATAWNTTTTGTLSDTNWHHVAVTVSGVDTSVKIYFDGKLEKSDTHTITGWTPSSGDANISLCIGCLYPYGSGWGGNSAHVFDGKLDEIRIFTSALTANQVEQEYNFGKALVLGSSSTDSSGNADWSAAREYCVPGDTTSCSAPVGEWKFDEGLGLTAQDTSTKDHSASFAGEIIWNNSGNCKQGSCLQMLSAGHAYVTDTTDHEPANVTIEAWVNLNEIGDQWIISKQTATYDDYTHGYVMRTDTPSNVVWCYFGYGSSQVQTPTVSIRTQEWRHVACTYNGSTATIYIDGVYGGSNSGGSALDYTNVGNLGLGGHPGDIHPGEIAEINGHLDLVRIYNYARTPAQIAWGYNRGKPIGWWKFDECQGTAVDDWSLNGNGGTITIGGGGTQDATGTCTSADSGDAWYNGASGKYSASLSLDGVDDYASTADSPSLDMGTMTIAAWIKTSRTTEQYIVERNNQTFYFATGPSTSKLCFYINTVSAAWNCSTTSVTDGTWHHVVGTWDGTNKRLYVDGVPDSTFGGAGGNIANSTYGLNIGVRKSGGTPSGYFSGQLDDVQLFNYPITATQVRTLYNESSAVRF